MRNITVKVHPSKANLKKKDQLAWKIAEIASDKAKINNDAIEIRRTNNVKIAQCTFSNNNRGIYSIYSTSSGDEDYKGEINNTYIE